MTRRTTSRIPAGLFHGPWSNNDDAEGVSALPPPSLLQQQTSESDAVVVDYGATAAKKKVTDLRGNGVCVLEIEVNGCFVPKSRW